MKLPLIALLESNFQIEEILNLWNDREHGGVANREDLIVAVNSTRCARRCQPLIKALGIIEQGEINVLISVAFDDRYIHN